MHRNDEVTILDHTHIPAMLALQAASGDGMILPRSAQTLRDHFNAGHTALGIFDGGVLVAQSLISTGPVTTGDARETETLRLHFNSQSLMGGVVVAHAARGRKLMDKMITAWLDRAAQDGIGLAHARIRVGNEASHRVFTRNAFAVTARAPSPDHPHHDVFFMHRPLQAITARPRAARPALEKQP